MLYAEGVEHTVPQVAITYNPDTGKYGFSVWVPGQPPHDEMEVFDSAEAAQNWIDPLNERVWEEPEPGAGPMIAISREYKPGSLPTRV